MYQTFVAPMKCPSCGVTTKDSSTMMQVRELPSAGDPPLYLELGARVRMRFEHVAGSGFEIVRDASKAKSFRLLLPWRCPSCGTHDQCAIAEFAVEEEQAVLRSITPAPRSKETIARVDAVSRSFVKSPRV